MSQNPTLQAQQASLSATKANEITSGLRPNPNANLLAEQFAGDSASETQNMVSVSQTIGLGGRRQRRMDAARAAHSIEMRVGWRSHGRADLRIWAAN